MASIHSSLNYTDEQMNPTISGSISQKKFYPEGPSSAVPGSEISIKLKAVENGSYIDPQKRMMLKFDVKPVGANLVLNREGNLGFFDRLIIQTTSTPICDIEKYSNVVATLMDIQVSQSYTGNVGALVQGTTCSNIGQTLTDGATYSFSVMLQGDIFSMSDNYLPLFGA